MKYSLLLILLIPIYAFSAAPNYDLTREAGDAKGVITYCGQHVQDILVYARGTSFDARTDALGNFKISYFQQGTYDLAVKKDGNTIGIIAQIIVVKKQTTDVGLHNFCNDLDGDSYSPPEDCDDSNPNINPSVAEACNDGVDNNCNGITDEECLVCTDNDGDGFYAQLGCGTSIDCDDNNAVVNPQALEVCDNIDNNCDAIIDETGSIGEQTFYLDADGDGYGSLSTTIVACSPSPGYVSQGGDCDDNNYLIYTPVPETCNNVDDDCDGVVDNNLTDLNNCPLQVGVCSGAIATCAYGSLNCQLSYGSNYEFVEFSCDGLDNDCDGQTDEVTHQVINGSLVCQGGAEGGQTLVCDAGYSDCDNNINNGCETSISSDPYNCGACFNICPSGDQDVVQCVSGQCTF